MTAKKLFEVKVIVADGIPATQYNHNYDYPKSQVGIVMDVPGFSHLSAEAFTFTNAGGKYVFTLRLAYFYATNAAKLEKAVRDALKNHHNYNNAINYVLPAGSHFGSK